MRRTHSRINRNKNKMPKHLPTRPDVLLNSIWLKDAREQRETIQVISPNYSTTPEDSPHRSRPLNLVTHFPEASGDSNTAAKVKRQLDEQLRTVDTDHSFGDHDTFVTDYVYSQFFDENHATNDNTCYTIKRNTKSNISMDNQYADVEVIQRDDLNEWNTEYEGNITSFEQECDDANRVIWIYSYKNKNGGDEQDYELDSNMPTTSASYINDNAEYNYEYESCEGTRVATPVPSEYVPRLDFSKDLALPTVTEISEKSSDSRKSTKQEVMSRKSFNSWFSEFDKNDVKSEAEPETKSHEPTPCRLFDKNVGTERVLVAEAQSQTQNKYDPIQQYTLAKNRSEISTRTIDTQTELIMQCVHTKMPSEHVASNQTFVISVDDNIDIQTQDANIKYKTQNDTSKSETSYGKSKKSVRYYSAPTKKLKHSPHSSNWSSIGKAMAKSRRKIVRGYDGIVKTRKCLTWPNESTPHRRLNDSRSQGSQTCSCIKSPRKLAVNVPPSLYEISPVLDSLRALHLSLGDDLDDQNMSWWQRFMSCVLCR